MKSKGLTVFLLCIGTCFSILAQEGEELFGNEKPVVAVVLAGGGALGYAHVGALKVMEEEGIQPDLVLGSSMGSIIGALYCAGYTPDELQNLIESADWKHILLGGVNRNRLSFTAKNSRSENLINLNLRDDIEPYEAGLSSAQHVVEFLDELLLTYNREMSFDDLPIPFRSIGTDLLTGERIIYSSGDLKTAIRGSMAVPGIFTPVFYDDRYIIDGGWADNLPATVARSMGADIVISVSLYGMIEKIEELNSLSAVTYQADQIRTRERLARSIYASDLVISPNLLSFTPADFEKGSELIEKGYEAASLRRDELKAIRDRIGEGSRSVGRYVLKDEKIGISEVTVNDNTDSLLGLRIGEYIEEQYQGAPSGSELQDYIYSFYNSGEYDHIWYQLITDGEDGFVLQIDAPEKTIIDTLGLSLNFTSALSRTELSDYEVKTEITLNRGKRKQDFFSVGLLLSRFPSIYGNWEKHSLGGGFIWGAGIYNYNTPFYSFKDGTVDSYYAINSFGTELEFKIPLLNIMSFGSSIYSQYSILDYRSGSHTIEYDDWIREGIRLTAAVDTLDRVIAPRSGLNALFVYDISHDRINERLGKGRTAGELFIPFFSKRIIGEISWETYLTNTGEFELIETGYAGQAIGIDGFYPQELRDNNILMGRIGLRVKIGELPLGLGNEIYLQTRINGVTLWENVFREYADPYAFSGGSAGFLLNTIIGELYFSGTVNSENRFGINLSLTSTRSLNKGL